MPVAGSVITWTHTTQKHKSDANNNYYNRVKTGHKTQATDGNGHTKQY
jgi:hypothetical protein